MDVLLLTVQGRIRSSFTTFFTKKRTVKAECSIYGAYVLFECRRLLQFTKLWKFYYRTSYYDRGTRVSGPLYFPCKIL